MFRPGVSVVCFLVLLVVTANAEAQQPNPAAVADVASGKLKEARASWWGFDPEDATSCLQQAIDSKVPKLIIDNVGKSWIVTPVKLASNQEIVFEKGVEVLAKVGAFKGGADSLITGSYVENVTLIGHGATLRMRRADYTVPANYVRAEWRHTLNLLSCRHVKVIGLTCTESGGDGIYLGTVKPGETNKDIHIDQVTCHRNYRQGISVISAEDLTIENTTLSDTAGTAPQAGIDFEPDHPEDRIVNCVMRRCTSANNAGYGFLAALGNLSAKSTPVSVRIEDCKASGNKGDAVAFYTGNAPEAAVTGTLDVLESEFQDTGLEIRDNPPAGCRIGISNCTFSNTKVGNRVAAPIRFMATSNCVQDLGGATIEKVTVAETDVSPIQLVDLSGLGFHVVGINGTMTFQRAGKGRPVKLTEPILVNWIPQLAVKRIPRVKLDELTVEPFSASPAIKTFDGGAWRVRGTGAARVWAKKGQNVTVAIKVDRVGNQSTAPVELVVTSTKNETLVKQELPLDQETSITFATAETGVYRLASTAGPNDVVFHSSTHPLSLEAEAGGIHFIYSTGTLFFVVPKGAKEFGVKLRGDSGTEGVRGTLLNPAGRVVAEKDNIIEPHQFTVNGRQAVGGIWSLTIAKPTGFAIEDYWVDVSGVAPLFAPTKAAALKAIAKPTDARE